MEVEMFEELTTIRISGRCFPPQTDLDIFVKKSGNKARPRISLIFGRNGSGKTTLSEALRKQSLGHRLEDIADLQLLDGDGSQIPNMDEALLKVKVFNEKYVDEKLRVEGDGLGSIVMLGDAGNIKDEIENKTAQKETATEERKTLETQLERSESPEDELCPDYWKAKLLAALKGDAHWASRKKHIDGDRKNARVDDRILTRIIGLEKPDSDLSVLAERFQAELADYQSIGSGSAEKLPACPTIPSWMSLIDEEQILSLLRKPIEKPELTEREQRILSVIQNRGLPFVRNAQSDLTSSQPDLCPYCLRPITSKEIADIRDEVSAVLADEVKKHVAELGGALLENRQELDLEPYASSLRRETDSCRIAYEKCLDIITRYERLLEQKKCDPFTPVDSASLGLSTALGELSESLANLRKETAAWNERVDQADKQRDKLCSLSDMMARIEIDQPLIAYKSSTESKEICIASLNHAKETETTLERELSSLNARLNNTNIALSKLNTMLAVVFGDCERLRLEPIIENEKAYRLISRGAHVRPEDVSSGERNAIALCYFFTQIGEGKARGKEYGDETLLVIDDPVSSFDFENKVGILSLVKRFVRMTLQGNPKSRAILMTHDYLTMKSFVSACKNVNQELKNVRGQKPKEFRRFTLVDWDDKDAAYDTLLNKAYAHTLNPSDETRDGLGNAARRMMEAFSTFEYNCPFDELALQEGDRALAHDPFLNEYFHDFQFKLAMHQESHLKDPINSEGSIETPDSFSSEGIDRSIREALCLIYLLNKEHILAHISDSEAESHFDGWIDRIKSLNSYKQSDA